MSTPINNFQDILDAIRQDPALRDALRRHILTEELMQLPLQMVARLDRMEESIGTLQEGQASLVENVGTLQKGQARLSEGQASIAWEVARIGGDVSRLTGDDYESYVAVYADRYCRRGPGIHARVITTQRDPLALKEILDQAEIRGTIQPRETNDANWADLVLAVDGQEAYILDEVSVTIQQDDVDTAARRTRILARATGRIVTPFVIGTGQEPGLQRGDVQALIIPEPGRPEHEPHEEGAEDGPEDSQA